GFGRNPHNAGAEQEDGPSARWLLASASTGGAVALWDLRARRPTAFCDGADWDVSALAFNPDGTILASVGRSIKLWDVATGRPLLVTGGPDHASGVAFSPDGRRLAVSGSRGVAANRFSEVYDLEFGRGLYTVRGLTGHVTRV